MKYTKNYNNFLNEAKFDYKKFRKEAEAIPFKEWEVVWGEGPTDGYYMVATEYKGKYYLCYGGVVNAGDDLEYIDFGMDGEYLDKIDFDNLGI